MPAAPNETWLEQAARMAPSVVISSAAIGTVWEGIKAATRREPIGRAMAIGAGTSAAFGLVATAVLVSLERSGVLRNDPAVIVAE